MFQGFNACKGLSLVKFPANQQPLFLTKEVMHATTIENNSQSLT